MAAYRTTFVHDCEQSEEELEQMKKEALAWSVIPCKDGHSEIYFVFSSDDGIFDNESLLAKINFISYGNAVHVKSALKEEVDEDRKHWDEMYWPGYSDRYFNAELIYDDEEADDDVDDDDADDTGDIDYFNNVACEASSDAENQAASVLLLDELTYGDVMNAPNPSSGYGELSDMADWKYTSGSGIGYSSAVINGIKCRLVPEFPGLWAGEDGSIWSQLSYNHNGNQARLGYPIDRYNGLPVRRLKPQKCLGYDVISYPKIGVAYGYTHVYVHRLVYAAWVSPLIDGHIVIHNDGVPDHNAPSNLFMPLVP